MDNDRAPSWNIFDDEPDLAEENPPKSRPDFFGSYLAGRLAQAEQQKNIEASDEDDEEDDEDNPRKTKKKRQFTGLLNEIFPKIVVPEKSESGDGKKGEVDTGETIDEKILEDTAAEEIPQSIQANNQENSDTVDALEGQTEPFELKEQADINIKHSNTEEFKEQTDEVDKYEKLEDSKKNAPSIPPPLEATRLQYDSSRGVDKADKLPLSSPGDTVIHEKTSVGALLAFLGAEFLSRRRDKKLSSEIKSQGNELQKGIANIKTSQLSQQEAQEKLRVHQQRQAEKLVQLDKPVGINTHRKAIETKHPSDNPRLQAFERPIDGNARTVIDAHLENNHLLYSQESSLTNYNDSDRTTPEELNRAQYIEKPPIEKNDNDSAELNLIKKNNSAEYAASPEDYSHESLLASRRARRYTSNRTDSLGNNGPRVYSEFLLRQPEDPYQQNQAASTDTSSQQNQVQGSYKQAINYGVGSALLIMLFLLVVYLLL